MTKMPPQEIDLVKLRNIGWTLWDPLSLLGPTGSNSGKWHDEKNLPFADEYDSYLLCAAESLRKGTPQEQVVDYLIEIETQHMCLQRRSDTLSRAEATIAALFSELCL